MERAANAIIEWHRPMGKGVVGPLIVGAFLMTVGGLAVLLSLPRATTIPYMAVLGGACMVTAFLTVVISLMRRAGKDSCLILRRDAIVLERNDETTTLRWDDVKEIRIGTGGAIDIERKDGSIWTISEGFSKPEKLVARMEEVRRKTSFGLI